MKYLSIIITSLFLLSCQSSDDWEQHFYQEALKAKEENRNYDYYFYSSEIKRSGYQFVNEIKSLEVTPKDNTLLNFDFFYSIPYSLPSSIQDPYTVIIDKVSIDRADFFTILKKLNEYIAILPKKNRIKIRPNFPPGYTPLVQSGYDFNNWGSNDFSTFDNDFEDGGFGDFDRNQSYRKFNKIDYKKSAVNDDGTISFYAEKLSIGNFINIILGTFDLVITHTNGEYFYEPGHLTKSYKCPIELSTESLKKYIEIIPSGDKDFKIISNKEILIKHNPHWSTNDLVPFEAVMRKFNYEIWTYKHRHPYSRVDIEKFPNDFQKISSKSHNINFESTFDTNLFSLKYGAKEDSFIYSINLNEKHHKITHFPCDLIYELPDQKFLLLKLR